MITNMANSTQLVEGREYLLEFYMPAISGLFLGNHRIVDGTASIFVYEDAFMKSHNVLHVIYVHPEKIEVNENDKPIVNENMNLIEERFNEIGFNKVTVSNFKSGNLNLTIDVRAEN